MRIPGVSAYRFPLALLAAAFLLIQCGRSDTAPPIAGPVGPAGPDSAIRTPLVIEEIVPGNVDFQDERGEDPGWVEISNVADSAIPLGAWRLRGADGDGPAWRLPDTALPPGGRMLVFLSGLDRRSAAPAGDTLQGFSSQVYAWSDSMNNPPGRSSFGTWEIAGSLRGFLMPESLPAVSATLNFRDYHGTDLEWSEVSLAMTLPQGLLDVGDRDRLLLRATLPEGQPMVLRFCEKDQSCWLSPTLRVTGTGRRLDTYDLSLLGVRADFRRLAQIHFVPPAGRYGAYRLTVADLRFYRSARRPHASFELRRKGGVLHLEDTAGTLRQTVAYPEMPATASWARLPPTFQYVLREKPSPEEDNPAGAPEAVLPAPDFLTPAGFHDGPVIVRLAPAPGAIVRCAADGGLPGPASPDAAVGIRLDTTRALSCAVFDSTGRSGPVESALFLVGERPALPVVSLVLDSEAMFDPVTGMYMEGPNASPAEPRYGANYWEDTELPAQIAFFEKDGRRAFSEKAGLSIFGNWSRSRPKRSLAIQFRERYGARRIQYPLFPQRPGFTRFKGLVLRNNGGDYAAGFSRDALGALLTEGRDLEYQLSRHVAVYINGRYWGIYDMRERLDADYLDTRFGLPSEAVDLIKNGGEVQAGTATEWIATVDWFLGADLSDSAALARAAERVDVDNMATYLAAEIWASNADWPANNTRHWRRKSPAGPWRSILFDLDGGVGGFSGERDMFAFLGDSTVVADYPNGPRSTVFFRKLSANPAWRSRFANRLCVLLATNFAPARAIAALDSMQGDLAGELDRDFRRWGLSPTSRNAADARVRVFLRNRPASVLAHMQAWYRLGDTARVALSSEGGRIAVEGYDLGSGYQGIHFEGLPIRVEARAVGKTFEGWSDGELSRERVIVPGPEGVDLSVRFR
jgi:hypothetical protein